MSPTPPYALVVFDFDGTLADSFPWFFEASNTAAARHGFRQTGRDEVARLRDYTPAQVIRHLGLPMWKLPAVTQFIRRWVAEHADAIPLFPGVPEMLERLDDAGVALAIVSTNTEPTVRRVLGPRLAGRIRHYGCGASLFGKRPKLRQALAAAGVRPAQALCVGDEVRDAEAARAERVAFGAVTWGFASAGALRAQTPAVVFDRVEEIAARLAPRPRAPLSAAGGGAASRPR